MKYTKERPMRVISLGLGQQSVALYLMSSMGIIQRADYAVFSDTMAETKETYKYLEWLSDWRAKNNGIPIIVTGKSNIYKDLIYGLGKTGPDTRKDKFKAWLVNQTTKLLRKVFGIDLKPAKSKRRFPAIPAFTRSESGKVGKLQRQCTYEYKITEVNKAIRSLHGILGKKRTPPTEIWMGITTDEIERMKYPRFGWQTYVYPFCDTISWKSGFKRGTFDLQFNRLDCVNWLEKHGFPIPPKSACFFCPFQSDARWLDMKKNRPDEWQQSVTLDKEIRNSTRAGLKSPVFLHSSAVPLDEVDLQENQLDLFSGECHGVCGI